MVANSTITLIAERAGVSAATVSRALNNQPGVSDRKRREIVALASELNYHPNVIARSLQGKRTGTLAYVADISLRPAADLLFKDFITVLAGRCAGAEMDLLILPATDSAANTDRLGRVLRSGRADGLIIADTRSADPRLEYLLSEHLTFVAFGRAQTDADYPYVDVDNERGTRLATDHLLRRGHRRIAFIGIPIAYFYASHRRDGYLRALQAVGIPYDERLIAFAGNESEARAVMHRLLDLPEPPTAFVAASDMLAIHAMTAAAERGLRAGDDYAIVGFDDLPLAAHTNPPLTTIRQPFAAICDELISVLLRVIDGAPGARHVLLAPELVVRASCGTAVRT